MRDKTAVFHQGWLPEAERRNSPFFNARPEHCQGRNIDLIVVHCISLPAGDYSQNFVDDLFMGRLQGDEHPSFIDLVGLEVSSHFFIRRDGRLMQYVSCDDRAWHAGESCWQDRQNCNDFSIGIELEGIDSDSFTLAQYECLSRLSQQLMQHYSLSEDAIVGHCDVAPGRKTDPGPGFDWAYFRQSLALV